MDSSMQPALLAIPEQPERSKSSESDGPVKLRLVNRNQLTMVQIDVEHLIDEQHPARGIWDVCQKLDVSRYEAALRTREGEVGRAAWPPLLLVAVWLYGYSRGITSARELERQMAYEPGLMWLTGMEVINHHTLSDFRIGHREALTGLFTQLLVVLTDAKLVKMELVAHDGTKIRAQAGIDSFRREVSLGEKLAQARRIVEQQPTEESGNQRQQAAQQRARRERAERVEAALEQLKSIRKADARVSVSEAEARRMKHGDHAIVPSYNVQVSTDADSGVIVGVGLSQAADDSHQLLPAVQRIEENLQRKPKQVVADGGFTNRATIEQMAASGIDFYGSIKDPKERSEAAMKSHGIDPQFAPHFFILQPEAGTAQCPAGKRLRYLRRTAKRGDVYVSYRANGADCMACGFQKQCCPKNAAKGRIVSFREQERESVARFREKMAGEKACDLYRRRGPTAEFPFACFKERMKLRKFRLFGMAKAGMEALWASLAHNVLIWIRLVRRPAPASA